MIPREGFQRAVKFSGAFKLNKPEVLHTVAFSIPVSQTKGLLFDGPQPTPQAARISIQQALSHVAGVEILELIAEEYCGGNLVDEGYFWETEVFVIVAGKIFNEFPHLFGVLPVSGIQSNNGNIFPHVGIYQSRDTVLFVINAGCLYRRDYLVQFVLCKEFPPGVMSLVPAC